MAPLPTTTLCRTIEPEPISTSSPMVQPSMCARWPMTTRDPMIVSRWPGAWTTEPSCTLLRSPTTMRL
jgi:hypothetical protein